MKTSGPAVAGETSAPSANVITQAGSTEGAHAFAPVPSTEIRGGRSWIVTKRARSMIKGEVYHALRRVGVDKAEARRVSQDAVAWCRALPPVPAKRSRDPQLQALYADRAALAQAFAFAWLKGASSVEPERTAA